MAWRKLAVLLGNSGRSPSRQVVAATNAYRHRDRLPAVERDLAGGAYYSYVEFDRSKSIAAYRSILAANPEELTSLNNLAAELGDVRRYAEAESLLVKATSLSRGITFYGNLLLTQVNRGEMAAAQATLDRFAQFSPGTPSALSMAGGLATAKRDLPTAIQAWQRIRERYGDIPFWRRFGTVNLAAEYEQQGRVAEARRLLLDAMDEAESASNTPDYLKTAAMIALLDARYTRTSDAARPLVDALARHPLKSLDSLDRPYPLLVLAFARAGRAEEAHRLLGEYENLVPERLRAANAMRWWALGAVAEAEHRDPDALASWRNAYEETGNCGACALYEMATSLDRMGQADSALAVYERFVTQPSVQSVFRQQHAAPAPAYKRLGELYEARHDRKKAADYYGRFIDLYQNADPELQPGVREVRERLARLAQEPGA